MTGAFHDLFLHFFPRPWTYSACRNGQSQSAPNSARIPVKRELCNYTRQAKKKKDKKRKKDEPPDLHLISLRAPASLSHICPSHTCLQFLLCTAPSDTEYISTHFTVLLLFIINNRNVNSALVGTSMREIVFVKVNKEFPKMPRRLKQPCSFPAQLERGTSQFLSPLVLRSFLWIFFFFFFAWRI